MKPTKLILIILLVLIWGFNFVVIEIGLHGMPPIFLACARFFLTAIPFIFFFKRPNIPFPKVILYGLVMFALQFSLFFQGMNLGVPPGLASILIQIHAFFSLFLAHWVFREKIKPWQLIGALISFSGIAYAGFYVEGSFSLAGFFFLIAAAACWGTGSAISKTLGQVNMISLVVWGSMVSWPPLLALSLLIEGPLEILSSLQNLSLTSLAAVLYLAYLSTLFGYGLWCWLIHHEPLSKVAPFTLLVPIIAMLSSILVLDEPLTNWKIGASLLVIGGLCLNFLGPRLFSGKKPKADSTYRQN